MAEKPTARVSATFEVPAKLAPQLAEILRGVPAQFPCTLVEVAGVPEVAQAVKAVKKPAKGAKEVTPAAVKKLGLMGRIFGKGK